MECGGPAPRTPLHPIFPSPQKLLTYLSGKLMSLITVRPLHTIPEFKLCVQVAREVWADADLDTEPHVTYVIAHHTGGQVLGAFDGATMVGFTKAYVGLHDHTPYFHSHMAAVLPSYRDRGIGRLLKLVQREDALRRDIRLIEWTFDPLETKNAHFNFNRLGGISRRYIPDFYGITTSPLHRGIPTDRLLVEWRLDSPRVIAAIGNLAPAPPCPAQIHLPKATHDELIQHQSRLRSEFTGWFAKGYAATALRQSPSGVDYCLSPYSDF
jgi:predicted GNAT superfamily acetyltransferase